MDSEPHFERSLLRFSEEVKVHFAFLVDYGFHCSRSQETLMRFESERLAINVFHGRQSYEIGLQLEDVLGSESYSFSEVLRLVNYGRAEHYRDYATRTVEGVAAGVRELASLFRKCVDTGVLNDSEFFRQLKMQREVRAKSYALETQLVQARMESESAWGEKDFSRVVQILTPLQEHLSLSELRKLEYAKKQFDA